MRGKRAQISEDFFESCQNLKVVEEPFTIDRTIEEYKIRNLESEFELIRALTQTKKHRMGLRSNAVLQNKKNRYPEQSVYEHSRVVLFDKQETNEEGYINANQIPIFSTKSGSDYKLILTQGPTDNTIPDFKRMIEQQNIECVVMLCRLVESGKSRCSDYVGNCKMRNQRKVSDYLTVRTVDLGEIFGGHSYEQVHYSEWPDKKVPSELNHISELIELIRPYKRVVIHCSAGLGRSGVISALLLIMLSDLLIQQNKLSVFQTVRRIRQYRFGAIQNSEQYAFLYQFFSNLTKNTNISTQLL